jgi:hypothetical protein
MVAVRYRESQQQKPELHQQIAAILVSWGQSTDTISLMNPQQLEYHLEILRRGTGEQQVRSAEWLSLRGVRQAGSEIASAMNNPNTLRPCQFAKNLGSLGDDRWVDLLAEATRSKNEDLGVCATISLKELASPKTVDTLIDIYRRDIASISAIDAIGRISDSSSHSFLLSVVRNPRSKAEKLIAQKSIEKIVVMSQSDPIPELKRFFNTSLDEGTLDLWATRKIAEFGDKRTIPMLKKAFVEAKINSEYNYSVLAAALLMHGEKGVQALKEIGRVNGSEKISAKIARAALSLCCNDYYIMSQNDFGGNFSRP